MKAPAENGAGRPDGSPPLPTVSVVVAARNAEATIEECLRSLAALDFPKLHGEVIVVDNASTDRTRELVERVGGVRLLREPKRGPAAARNTGVRAARGEWIAFTDADCIVTPEWLSELVMPLEDETVGIAGGRILSVRPCNRIEMYGERIHDHRRAIEEFVPPYVITMNWASRRSVLIEAGLFDESLLRGSDAELSARIHARGYRLVYRPTACIRHRNERTLRGLFDEGFVHGRASGSLAATPGYAGLLTRRRRFPVTRRILGNLKGWITGAEPGRFDTFCALVFDLGKGAGRAAARFSRHARAG